MTIKAYRADGATASIDTAGLSETVVFRVEGLRYKSPASWMHEALHASGLPRPGEAHPVQTGVQVLGLNAERVTADIARVRVSYGVPTDGSALAGADPGTIDIAATTQVEVVSTSQYGVPIQVSYTSVVLDSDGNETQVTEAKGVEDRPEQNHGRTWAVSILAAYGTGAPATGFARTTQARRKTAA